MNNVYSDIDFSYYDNCFPYFDPTSGLEWCNKNQYDYINEGWISLNG